MKKRRLILFIVIIGTVAGIQFIPVDKPQVIKENPNDLIVNNDIPEAVSSVLINACYDCHSNETNYPWYAYVYPVKVPIFKHIQEGRDALNFSDWERFKKLDKLTILDDAAGEVLGGDMPIKSYTRLHSDAELSEEQKETFVKWTEDFANALFQ